jgi:hypothetical protein
MTDREIETKLAELDRLLNDPDVRMDPHRVWSLLAEVSAAPSPATLPPRPNPVARLGGFAAHARRSRPSGRPPSHRLRRRDAGEARRRRRLPQRQFPKSRRPDRTDPGPDRTGRAHRQAA